MNPGQAEPQLMMTGDGSHTLVDPVSGDTYHSVNGAETESLHVFIRNGLDLCRKTDISVLECGFGTGLNALLTLEAAAVSGKRVHYTALEKYPVPAGTARSLSYSVRPFFMDMHSCEWGRDVTVSPGFTLHKIAVDLAFWDFKGTFDIVYFDMFAPDTLPGLWTTEVFERIYGCLAQGGIFVTFSSKGDVKRALRGAGFEVTRCPGPPGKRHMVRAVKL